MDYLPETLIDMPAILHHILWLKRILASGHTALCSSYVYHNTQTQPVLDSRDGCKVALPSEAYNHLPRNNFNQFKKPTVIIE
jgi:hypothetical protein